MMQPASSSSTSLNTNQENTSTTLEPNSIQEAPINEQSSDQINWNEVHDPLINAQIKVKLQAVIQAIVSKDVKQFHMAVGKKLGKTHDYLLDNTMNFTKLDTAHQEGNRVLIPAHGELKVAGDETMKEANYTFYFEKDNTGNWIIVAMD